LRFRLVASLAVIGALLVTSVAIAASQHSTVVKPIKITVTLRDYSFKFSRTSVPKGSTVIFTIKNAGSQPHNLDLVGTGKRSPIMATGKTATLKVVFKAKKTIQVVCDVPRHIQLGMVSSFKVK
jgi:uncharacterized cupredoxin-like copper-binding protein